MRSASTVKRRSDGTIPSTMYCHGRCSKGIDGLANLVQACRRCNTDKRHSLPAAFIVDQVLARDRAVLEDIALSLEWPTQYERTVAAARGIYLSQPEGTPTWTGVRSSRRLDLGFAHWWLDANLS